jgi:mRNA degradation ribonuclease J1/J2
MPFSKWPPHGHFENGDRKKFFNVRNKFGTLLSTHISNFDDRKMLNFYRPYFMTCFGSHCENGRHFEHFENAELLGKGGQSNIFRASKGVGATIEFYGKVEISYINVDNF